MLTFKNKLFNYKIFKKKVFLARKFFKTIKNNIWMSLVTFIIFQKM